MTQIENIKFSILVPVYNVENYIDACIHSVINQTYTNWELILVDDGTPDHSGKICDRYQEENQKIKVIHKENQGALSARLVGITNATGDYYCFLDSDDCLNMNALQVLFEKINLYHCDCIMYGHEKFYGDKILSKNIFPDELLNDKRQIYKRCLGNSVCNSLWLKCTKSKFFKNLDYTSYYKYSLAEDLLQSVDIYKNITSLLFISDCLYKYRTNPESITHTIKYETYSVDHCIREYVLDFLEKENLFTKSDMKEYVGYALKILSSEILQIISFDTGFENRKRLLNDLREDRYFKRLLDYHCGIKNIGFKAYAILSMYRLKMDWLIDKMVKKNDKFTN